MKITLTNFRSRKFGWAYSFTPGEGTNIEIPSAPAYEGTLAQLDQARATDRTFQAHRQTAFHTTAWFYRGRRITHTWVFTNLESTYTDDGQLNPNVFYGYAWVEGFHPPDDDQTITLRLE